MRRYLCLMILFLLSVFVGVCQSAVIHDHFDDGVLDPAWNTTFTNVIDWTYTESDSKLIATDITMDPSVTDSVPGAVTLSRNIGSLDDFSIEASIAWDAEGLDSRIEVLCIYAMSGDQQIVYQAYDDSWIQFRAEKEAIIGYDNVYSSGLDTLPYSGQAVFKIDRLDGLIKFYWDDELIHSGTDYSLIDEIAIEFRRNAYPGSTFGTLSIDYITVIPEPGTILLFGLGAFILRRKR